MPRLTYLILIFLFLSGYSCLAQQEYIITKKGELFGVANSKGKFIIPANYIEIQNPSGTVYAVKSTKGLWGFYNNEIQVAAPRFDNFRFTQNNQILTQEAGRWGAIDFQGNIIIPFQYKYINPIGGNKFRVGKFNQWSIRDFNNIVSKTFEYDSVFYLGDNVYKYCLSGKYGLMDPSGKVITTEFQNIFESTLVSKYPKKEFAKPAIILAKGSYKIPLEERFDTVYHFSEGFAKFRSGNKFGFVDSIGNIRLVPQYNNARHFSEGMVAIMLLGKWGFMDTDEKLIVQPYYDEVTDYKNGVTLVRKDKNYNFINKQGKFLYNDFFDRVIPTYSGQYLLYRKNKVGLADIYGHELVSTKYEDIVELGNSYILAKEHELWGVLNDKGNIVIPFNYSAIQYDPEHNRMITMEPGREIVIGN